MELEFELNWRVRDGDAAAAIEPVVFELLRGIRQGGHLNFAAREAGISYRHAWGLLRDWQQRFGKPLIVARQGRGAHLTDFGEALLDIAADAGRALAPELERAAVDASARLEQALDRHRHVLTIASSHCELMPALREALDAQYRVAMDVTGSEHALQRYRRGDADIAGFHLPTGELGRTVAARLISLLDAARDRVWLLERRTLGLLSRRDKPIASLDALKGGAVRFINRQPGSGTRLILDGLLGDAGIAPGEIAGYAHEEYTHTAVAAMIASGSADAGLATREAAYSMELEFVPLCNERFYLVLPRAADSSLRRRVESFCAERCPRTDDSLRADEYAPTIAALKRIHGAGFWKQPQRPRAAGAG